METGLLHALPREAVSHNAAIQKVVAVRRGTVPGVMQIARAEFPPGEVAHGHRHEDMWEYFCCEQGSGEMEIDGRVVALSPGVFVLTQPREWHEVCNIGDTPLVITVFAVADAPAG